MSDDLKPSCHVLEVFQKRIYGKFDPKELTNIIKEQEKYSHDMFIGLIYHIGIELSNSGIKDCNNERYNLGSELISSGDLLISFARRTSRNQHKLTLTQENKIFGNNNHTETIRELAVDVSKMSYKFVSEFIICLSESFLQDNEDNKNELSEIGKGIKKNIWNNICKKYSKEV